MDIRNSFDSLKSILGVDSTQQTAATAAAGMAKNTAAAEESLTAGDDGVRMDKVSNVQAALAAGTYNVPASAVASKVVDAMLSSGK
jgi:anti-sigma28 factor (negative regulator of flagellin synthesis)